MFTSKNRRMGGAAPPPRFRESSLRSRPEGFNR
nr:MAG TPA: hypothetical protein [Bacteriophage sp.]